MLIARSVHPLPGEAERRERLLGLVDRFSSRRILVVGDLIADEFIYGDVARVSREAPVLILKYDTTEILGGGALHAAKKIAPTIDACDAVLLSDYGSGLVTPALAASVRKAVERRGRRRPVPVLIDSRYRLLDYRGLTTCTPNESEVEQVLGIYINDDA